LAATFSPGSAANMDEAAQWLAKSWVAERKLA
jgi:hypothetical protein